MFRFRSHMFTLAAAFGLALAPALVAAPSAPASQTTSPTGAPASPRLTLAMELHVKVGAPVEVGAVPRGRRRVIPIEGGTFEGPGLRGRSCRGGRTAIVRADGLSELDTRYMLRTDSGRLIYIQNAGMRHAPPEITARLLAGRTQSVARLLPDRARVRDIRAEPAVADAGHLHRHRRASSIGRRDHPRLEGGVAAGGRRTSPERIESPRMYGQARVESGDR